MRNLNYLNTILITGASKGFRKAWTEVITVLSCCVCLWDLSSKAKVIISFFIFTLASWYQL
ncbi:hypothetical protein [Flavobacterium ginsengiterrae]|uniref:hypothetical protein n=1 Tax=Flavobacterium ginsengiterrae TaxID=871695 RepID=UPI0031F1A31E